MSNKRAKPSLFAPLGGVVVGIAVFLGVNITTGRAIIPTADSITNKSHGLSEPVRLVEEAPSATAGGGPYQTICITCHQGDGKGVPGAFPPLAGSEWLLSNPEIPVRVVILGLTGPISVEGKQFNSVMPPPPGLDDDKIAEAITYARSHFGNQGAKIDGAFVKKVRAELAGRTASETAAELEALKNAGAAPEASPEGAQGAAAQPETTPASAKPATRAAKAPKAPKK